MTVTQIVLQSLHRLQNDTWSSGKIQNINTRMILITEWNQKCNEKIHIPFSTTGLIMVPIPWFSVLFSSTFSWQPVAIICGQWVREGCEEWCCVFGLDVRHWYRYVVHVCLWYILVELKYVRKPYRVVCICAEFHMQWKQETVARILCSQ